MTDILRLRQTSATSWSISCEQASKNRELEFAWKLAHNRRVLVDQLRTELNTALGNVSYYKKLLVRNGISV